jgi:nicotinamidase-related amidase
MITAIDPKTALVLIDLQKGIMGMPTAHPTQDVIAKSAELVAAFRRKGLPVVIVHVNPLGAKWTKLRTDAPSHMPQDDAGVKQALENMTAAGFFDIVPEIKTIAEDIYITKTTWGAFYETDLHQQLQAKGITGIVLAGVATSIGVEGTAREASVRGYNITFAKDAMTDMVLTAHENSLQTIFPRLGELDDTAAIVNKLAE